MTREQSRALHAEHELERARHALVKKAEAHEHEVRDRERQRVAEFVGPGDGVEDDWGVT